jgi:hypothetical protein
MPRAAPFVHRNLPLLLLRAREALTAPPAGPARAWAVGPAVARARSCASTPRTAETGQLAERAYILGPSLTGMLARMERDGLVTRQRRGRAAHPGLGDGRGLALADGLSGSIEAQYEDLAAHLGQSRRCSCTRCWTN